MPSAASVGPDGRRPNFASYTIGKKHLAPLAPQPLIVGFLDITSHGKRNRVQLEAMTRIDTLIFLDTRRVAVAVEQVHILLCQIVSFHYLNFSLVYP
jgi:hypothetical protein